MNRRALLYCFALLMTFVGGVGPARGDDPGRKAMAVIIAAPANRSPAFQRQFTHDLGLIYTDLISGDQLTLINASTLQVVQQVTIPAELGDSQNERDNALEESFAPIFRFATTPDPKQEVDNIHIPALEREIGHNVMPTITMRPVNVIVIGSIQWNEPNDANWNFRSYVPSDFFLLQHGGSFGLAGDENSLAGARVSILYTDEKSSFLWEGFRNLDIDFWRKSIKGRGAAIGEVAPYAEGSYPRFFSTSEDARGAPIDAAAKMVLYAPGSVNVPVDRAGSLPLPPPAKETSNAKLHNRLPRGKHHHSGVAKAGGGSGVDHTGAGNVAN